MASLRLGTEIIQIILTIPPSVALRKAAVSHVMIQSSYTIFDLYRTVKRVDSPPDMEISATILLNV